MRSRAPELLEREGALWLEIQHTMNKGEVVRYSARQPDASAIKQTLERFGVHATDSLVAKTAEYVSLLLRWNENVSLTSITDHAQILERHFGESFFGYRFAKIESGNLLDVGSGAGFPGIPIALVCPNVKGTLLEPNLRKSVFLNEVVRSLGLEERIRVERARFEAFVRGGARFDFITTRAVRMTSRFLTACSNLLVPSGTVVLWLGGDDSMDVVRVPGWLWRTPARIPGSERRFVVQGKRREG